MKPYKGEELMKKDFFDALEEVYTQGGIGNMLMCQFYEQRTDGRGHSQLAKLAVYMEWKYGITCIKQIKTEHIYSLLEFLKENGFKDSTLKGYISAFSQVYKWDKHIFSEDFEIPTNTEFTKWSEKETSNE